MFGKRNDDDLRAIDGIRHALKRGHKDGAQAAMARRATRDPEAADRLIGDIASYGLQGAERIRKSSAN
jgi:hypothetical protein